MTLRYLVAITTKTNEYKLLALTHNAIYDKECLKFDTISITIYNSD